MTYRKDLNEQSERDCVPEHEEVFRGQVSTSRSITVIRKEVGRSPELAAQLNPVSTGVYYGHESADMSYLSFALRADRPGRRDCSLGSASAKQITFWYHTQ